MNDNSNVIAGIIVTVIFLFIIASVGNSGNDSRPCLEPGCGLERASGSKYCYIHKSYTGVSSKKSYGYSSGSSIPSTKSVAPVAPKTSTTSKSTKKTYDSYNVQNYKSAQDFADDKYEEFYDYEDDYEDEDEAYDAAEDYWREHHKK